MKRKAKKGAARKEKLLTTAELKKLYAGLQRMDGKISDALYVLDEAAGKNPGDFITPPWRRQ